MQVAFCPSPIRQPLLAKCNTAQICQLVLALIVITKKVKDLKTKTHTRYSNLDYVDRVYSTYVTDAWYSFSLLTFLVLTLYLVDMLVGKLLT